MHGRATDKGAPGPGGVGVARGTQDEVEAKQRRLYRSAMFSLFSRLALRVPSTAAFSTSAPTLATLNQVTRGARTGKSRPSSTPALEGCYQKKGVCAKVYTVKPKKPNSAVRKVAKVMLTTGRAIIAYIPGEGHSIQERTSFPSSSSLTMPDSVVLVRGGRTQDVPGLKYVSILDRAATHTWPDIKSFAAHSTSAAYRDALSRAVNTAVRPLHSLRIADPACSQKTQDDLNPPHCNVPRIFRPAVPYSL